MILPANKGHCVVVMDKTEYHAKVDTLLADQKFWTKIQHPALRAALLGLRKNGTIPELLYCRLRPSSGHIPLLYELLKIHKPGISIASFMSSPTYALSKYLARALSPLVGNYSSFVSSSSGFVSLSKSITIPEKYEF